MKKIGIAGLIVVALSGVFYEKAIIGFFKGDSDDNTMTLQGKIEYSQSLLERYLAFHQKIVEKDCYIDSISNKAALVASLPIATTDKFRYSYFSKIPVLYYCMSKDGEDLLGGHEIYMANVIFKDRYASNLVNAKKSEFKDVLITIRKSVHELNGEKGLEQGYNEYDIISPYTFAKGRMYFNTEDVDILRKYSKF